MQLLPFIKEANKHAPAHGKLDRHHVLFADPQKPLCYLGQRKIQRVRTYRVYEHEIEGLYRDLESSHANPNGIHIPGPALDGISERSLVKYVNALITEVTGIEKLDRRRDIFEAGVDLLQVMQLAAEIRLAFGGRGARACSPRDIYAHPTIGGLARFLLESIRVSLKNFQRCRCASGDWAQVNGAAIVHPTEQMRALLDKFVSSVLAVGAWNGSGPAPEKAIDDMSIAAPMGYGRSKLVAECLLDEAARRSGVQSAGCRVGIVAGPVDAEYGTWNKHKYIPSIVLSSAHLEAFPATFAARDVIDWLPVDKVPQILLEILASSSRNHLPIDAQGTEIFHVTNPNVHSWSGEFAAGVVSLFPRQR